MEAGHSGLGGAIITFIAVALLSRMTKQDVSVSLRVLLILGEQYWMSKVVVSRIEVHEKRSDFRDEGAGGTLGH